MRRWIIAGLCGALGCAPQPPPRPPPEIVPGEIIVHTADASLLTTEKLSAATGREDVIVREVHCLMQTCRVVVERVGAAADPSWTRSLVDALAASRVAGIFGVEPSSPAHRR